MTDKQIAAETLDRLPEGISLTEIAGELQVVAAIRQGQADVAGARVRPHEEVKQLFSTWSQGWMTQSQISS